MTGDLVHWPVCKLIGAYRRKKASPVEVMRAVLARIDRLNGKVNAICHLDRDGAIKAAKQSERRWAKGRPLGPLDGIPVTAKDTLHIKGMPTRWGSPLSDPAPQTEDSAALARLRESGAILFGKNTCPEYGTGPVTINPLTGITRNPWNLTRTSGGSSGGAASAVAAGFGPMAIGTDAGGSIRIPCSFTGLVGLKTTLGLVPVYPPMVAPLLSTTGSITRTVDDAAYILNVIKRRDGRDFQELPPTADDYGKGIGKGVKGLRVAFSLTLGYAAKVDDEVAKIVTEAAYSFRKLGARVEDRDPGFENPNAIVRTFVNVGIAYRTRHGHGQMASMGENLKTSVEAGLKASAIDYATAFDQRAKLHAHMAAFHEKYDLLMTPTLAVAAFPAERWFPEEFAQFNNIRAWLPFTNPFSLSQQPAITIPCGFTREGLPVGLQIVGAKYADALVLRAAKAYESANDWRDRRPALD